MYMPEMLLSLYFMHSQGYDVEIVELFQDNKSTQLLVNNGRFSSGKKTKHIKAKFFFIKDRIDAGEMKVTHCPTEEMWADVLTKPLQGRAFRLMRTKLMNCSMDYQLMSLTYRICFISLPIPVTGPEGPSKFLVLSW